MKERFYIAYGSNLSVGQMDARCPDAMVYGKAVLKDRKLVFRFHATVEECKGAQTPVAVWKISENDEKRLDRYEGYPKYYVKEMLRVKVKRPDYLKAAEEEVDAMVYIMAEGRSEICPPSRNYYRTLEEGYRTFGFDRKILEAALKEAGDICGREENHVISG